MYKIFYFLTERLKIHDFYHFLCSLSQLIAKINEELPNLEQCEESKQI